MHNARASAALIMFPLVHDGDRQQAPTNVVAPSLHPVTAVLMVLLYP
jgi:hypothetical protein